MDEKMTAYKIFRAVLGPIYRLWYNPKIIGKENIPEEGSFIIAGNHVHIMDQCNVVISTKRRLHYMAKKEYFEGSFKWFFQSAGCIPVDRSIKDTEATSSALEVLENNHALGLFPEGTRNSLKEEYIKELFDKYEEILDYKTFYKKVKKNKTSFMRYLERLLEEKQITKEEFLDNIYNVDDFLKFLISSKRITRDDYYENALLPLKFGAVSMAKKTNSVIVPYAITGDYRFRSNNLKVRIGEPFTVDEDLEQTNEKLATEIKKLMRENEENSGKIV